MSEWTSAARALDMLGLTIEEVEQATEKTKKRRENPDRHICICGHPSARHFIDGDIVSCKPAVWACLCHKHTPVLQVQDNRDFLYKTEGPGKEHALTKGITNAHIKKHEVMWLDGAYSCALCSKTEGLKIYSISGTENAGFYISRNRDTDYDIGKRNAFLCAECVDKI